VNLLKTSLEVMQKEVYKQQFAGFEQVDARACIAMIKPWLICQKRQSIGLPGDPGRPWYKAT
jgi:hypothetical protein